MVNTQDRAWREMEQLLMALRERELAQAHASPSEWASPFKYTVEELLTFPDGKGQWYAIEGAPTYASSAEAIAKMHAIRTARAEHNMLADTSLRVYRTERGNVYSGSEIARG